MLLGVLKIVSSAIAAAFGIFGLLTEFKDEEKRITPHGKIALSGIVVMLIVSVTISLLELGKERRNATKQAELLTKIRSLAQPIGGDIDVELTFSIKDKVPLRSGNPGPVEEFRESLFKQFGKGSPPLDGILTVTDNNGIPPRLRNDLWADQYSKYEIFLYPKGRKCADLKSRAEALALSAEDQFGDTPAVQWQYFFSSGLLTATRTLKMRIEKSSSNFASVGDVPGYSIEVVTDLASHDVDYDIVALALSSKNAGTFLKIRPGYENLQRLPDNVGAYGHGYHHYCYTSPSPEARPPGGLSAVVESPSSTSH